MFSLPGVEPGSKSDSTESISDQTTSNEEPPVKRRRSSGSPLTKGRLEVVLMKLCKYCIILKVITRENDPINLRLHEAYYIRKYKSGLNSHEECAELNDLLIYTYFFTHILEHFIKSLTFMRPTG